MANATRQLVGRGPELGALLAALDRARAGEPSLVVLDGEAGIGKTRLIEEVVGIAESAGALVLAGTCPPVAGRDLPLAPLLSAIRELVRAAGPAEMAAVEPARLVLAPFLPSLASVAGPNAREQGAALAGRPVSLGLLFEHVLALLERLAASRPAVVLVLEDLHWAAPSTWDLVAYLARNLDRARILVICSYREDALLADPRDTLVLSELARSEAVVTIRLSGLAAEEADELASDLSPALTPKTRSSVVARADGNPYFVTELVQAGGRAALPESIRGSVEARLAGVPDPVIRVLRVAALIGRRFDAELLIDVIGEPPDGTIAALRAAVRVDFLMSLPGHDERPDGYAFRHELVREIVAGELVGGERTRWHGRIARALSAQLGREDATSPERVIELASHWRASDDPMRAVPALLKAARAAEAMYAFTEAHRLYEQAFDTGRAATQSTAGRVLGFRPAAAQSVGAAWDAGPEWADLRAHAAEASSLAGNADRALELVDFALTHPARPATEVPGWRRRRARYLLEAGRGSEALEAYELLEADADALRAGDRARLIVAHAQALTSMGRYGDAARLAANALEQAPVGEHSLRWQALSTLGTAQTLGGQAESGLASLAEARVLAARRDSDTIARPRPSRIGEVLTAQLGAARALDQAGRSEGAQGLAADTAEAASRLGAVRSRGELEVASAWQQFRRGRWDDVRATCDALLAADAPAQVVNEALVVRGHLGAAQGRFLEADADLTRARVGIGLLGRPEVLARLQLASAELASWRHRHHDADIAAEEGMAALASTEERQLQAELCLAGLRSRVELHADAMLRRSPGEALTHAAAATRWLGELRAVASSGLTTPVGEADPRTAALVAVAAAEFSRIERGGSAPWGQAVRAIEGLGEPYADALVRRRLAEALLGEREGRIAAAPELRAAHATAEALHAEALQSELEALAARGRVDLGGRAGASSITEEPAVPGSDLGLTERELEVLGLLGRGRTNRQIATELFITEKTAGHHVSNILAKLGVSNRLEAAAAAHRAGLNRPNDG